jgi:hypothetical protein
MSANELHVDDTPLFQFDIYETTSSGVVAKDVSSYTTRELRFKIGTGTLQTKTLSLVTSDDNNRVEYQAVDGDIDEAGNMEYELRFAKTGEQFTSETRKLKVHANLS